MRPKKNEAPDVSGASAYLASKPCFRAELQLLYRPCEQRMEDAFRELADRTVVLLCKSARFRGGFFLIQCQLITKVDAERSENLIRGAEHDMVLHDSREDRRSASETLIETPAPTDCGMVSFACRS